MSAVGCGALPINARVCTCLYKFDLERSSLELNSLGITVKGATFDR